MWKSLHFAYYCNQILTHYKLWILIIKFLVKPSSYRIAVKTSVCNCYLMIINHHDLILTILDNQWDKGTIRICHIFIIVGSPWGSQFTNINTRMSHGESFLKSILGEPNSVLFDNDNQSQS